MTLYQDCLNYIDLSKNMAIRSLATFSCVYIGESFKNLLVNNFAAGLK